MERREDNLSGYISASKSASGEAVSAIIGPAKLGSMPSDPLLCEILINVDKLTAFHSSAEVVSSPKELIGRFFIRL